MADEKIIFGVSVDAKSAAEELTKLQKQITGLGGSDSLSGLIGGLTKVGAIAGVVGAAMFAAKKAFDFAIEGEAVLAIENQFKSLATQSGIAADVLSEGLVRASKGLIDESDLLKAANQSMVTLGKSAERLPELLELAGKAAAVSGKSVSETFTEINQAISTTNTRALKNLDIIIDQRVAYKKFADSIDSTVDALSQQGRQQAILNAVIEQGGKSFGAVSTSGKVVTDSVTRLQVALKDMGEAFYKVAANVIGPWLSKMADGLTYVAVAAKNLFVLQFGDAAEKARVSLGQVNERIVGLRERLENPNKRTLRQFFGLDDLNTSKEEIESQLQSMLKKRDALEAEIKKSRDGKEQYGPPVPPDYEDPAVVASRQSEFNKTLEEFRRADLEARRAGSLEVDNIKRAENERLDQIDREFAIKKELIETEGKFRGEQQKELFFALDQERENKRLALSIQIADAIEKADITSIERRIKVANNGWDKFSLGAQRATAKAKKSLMDFSAFGEFSVNTLANAFGSAFEQMGQGGINLGDALKKSLIGAVADIAAAKGKELIAASIFPPEPLGLAAGAGLMALSGVLRSSVGATASVPSGGGTAGGSAGGVAAPTQSAIYDQDVPAPDQFGATQRKSVTIQISGHYFDTQETNRQLVQMIRDAADATDYKILSVGGKV